MRIVAVVTRLVQSLLAILSCQAYWRLSTSDAGLAMQTWEFPRFRLTRPVPDEMH